MNMDDFNKLHEEAIIIDAVAPILNQRKFIKLYDEGGFTVVAPTVGGRESSETTFKNLGDWLWFLKQNPRYKLIKTVSDIRAAKQEGKLGIIFHFQGTEPVDADINLVDAYEAIGVRMVQLAYNVKNRVGTGCEELKDSGLSKFGMALVERLNANRIVVDCSHTGYQTTMDAIEASVHPVVISHANSRVLVESDRNITDEVARATARKGGVVGVDIVPFMVRQGGGDSTLDEFLAHIDHYVKTIGIEYVALGFDYNRGRPPFTETFDQAIEMWRDYISRGIWTEANYPAPPHRYPPELDSPAKVRNLTKALIARGYCADDVKKILGENWIRVFQKVWGA